MSRVELVEARQAPLLARPFYRDDGSASPLVGALAQVPELVAPTMAFIAQVFGETAIDLRTKEIVVLRLSAINACRYCTDTHTVAAWDAGLSTKDTAALCDGGAGLPAREAALVAWCDAFNAAPDPVPVSIHDALREHFAEPEVVELALLAGATILLNRFCTALELPTSPATRQRLGEVAGA